MSTNPKIAPPKVKGQRALARAKSAVTDEYDEVSGTQAEVSKAIESVVSTLNENLALIVTKAVHEINNKNFKVLSEIADAKDVVAFLAKLADPDSANVLSYSGHAYDLVSGTQTEVLKAVEACMSTLNRNLASVVERAVNSAPADSVVVVTALKSTMAATSAAIDSLTKATRQVVDFTDASVRAATAGAANALATENEGMPRLRDLKVSDDASANRELRYAKSTSPLVTYSAAEDIHGFIRKVQDATPMQLVDIEREGVHGRLLKDIAQEMDISSSRLFAIIGVPKATAEKKASSNEVIAGAGGQAALGLIRLLGIAQNIVHNSTADAARHFDAAKWLGRWIERPQPALGGNKPADLLDTPTGLQVVSRTLGAIESGAYL